ncbi:MAG TPA: 2-hydroxyacyl-CoA dehydratase family protein [Candidatus Binatia bacterium]
METAIRSKAFETFAEVAGAIMNPAVREWRAQGKQVVGYFCSHMPTELLMAAGLLPYRMRGTGSDGTELSDAFFSSINCSFPRHTFNLALKGEYDFLDGLVCVSSCDHIRRVYDNWKQNLNTPFLKIMSLPKKVGDPQVDWYLEEINILRTELEQHFNVQISDQRLRDAIKLRNETRRLQRQLYALRKEKHPPINGAETLAVMVAGSAMPAEQYNPLLHSLLEDLQQANGNTGKTDYRARLMIVGSELDDPDYVEVIEQQGGLVVTDSICYGTRTMWVDVDEQAADPVEALARYYIQERPSCPRMNGDQPRRQKFLQDMIREFEVDGVIGERMLFCDFWCAEHYMNKMDLKEVGVPFLQLDREYITSGKGQLMTRIQAFLETMGK